MNRAKFKIFLDGGDPKETETVLSAVGIFHGQTTNPSLVAKNPEAERRMREGRKFNKEEIYDFYRSIIRDIARHLPEGAISVEVYSDDNTSAEEMFEEGKEMFSWIPNAHIKYPVTKAGLSAAERSIQNGMRVNMTLVFSQEQAAAVHAATRGAKKGDVFVSPFIGRLDDKGYNGLDLIASIRKMYDEAGSHVEILAASVRSLDHMSASLGLGADCITAPGKVIREWHEKGRPTSTETSKTDLKSIPFRSLDLSKSWGSYDISHELTDAGLKKFAGDWNALLSL